MTISTLIHQIKHNFLTREVETLDETGYSQYNVLKRIYLYLDNRFESGEKDSQGNRKYFYNLCNNRNDQATKNIDIDSRDLIPVSNRDSEPDYLRAFLLRAEWQKFVKESGFGQKLNQLSEDLPRYGTVVWKKSKDDGLVRDVDLRNLINDPTAFQLKDGPVIERIQLRSGDLKAMKSWDQDVVDAYLRTGGRPSEPFMEATDTSLPQNYAVDEMIPEFPVFEFWGHVPETACPWVDEPDPNRTRYCMAVVGDYNLGGKDFVFFFKEVDPALFPYREIHYRRIKGRWLGQGNVERLFPLQERANELVNRFYRSIRIGTMHVFQTRDRLFTRNVYSDMEDGDIIESKSEITPVATEVRAFSQYQAELRIIEAQADRECTTFEIVTGESLPTNTPFRLGALQASSAGKIFDFIRENIGLFLEDVCNVWILPAFGKRLTREHILEIAGSVEDIQRFDDAFTKHLLLQEYKKYVLNSSALPTPEEVEIFKRSVQEQISSGQRKVRVDEDFFKDIPLVISCNPTGENKNKQAKMETLTNLLQILGSNPQALQNPTFAKVLSMALEESGGVSPVQLASVLGPAGLSAMRGALDPSLIQGEGGQSPGRQPMAPNASNVEGGLTPESVVSQAENVV